MKIKIKRVDKNLPLPSQDDSAACFDLVCRETVVIKPWEIKMVPLNVAIEVPDGYALLVISRSSTPMRKGLVLANGIGVLDPFFSGDKDEIKAIFLNVTKENVVVEKGEHLTQGMLIRKEDIEWNEVKSMSNIGRGGYDTDFNRKDKKR